MTLQRMNARARLSDQLDILNSDGGLVVEGMFSVDLIQRMRNALVAAAEGFEPGAATQGLGQAGKAFVGANTIRFSSLGKITRGKLVHGGGAN